VISGEEVRLSSGQAVDAVLASAAVPGVFPVVAWGSHVLVDGAVVNKTPISHAVDLGADRIVVLPPVGTARLRRAPRGALAASVGAVSRALTHRLAEDLVRYRDHAELVVLPAPEPPRSCRRISGMPRSWSAMACGADARHSLSPRGRPAPPSRLIVHPAGSP
jgi:NTE family protein